MTLPHDITDVFEMTPAQAGMLFQTLYAPGQGVYVQQYWGRLQGALDPDAFRAAWQAVIDRHDILRGQAHWQDLDRPAFAIHSRAVAEWQMLDCAEGDLDAWLAADRARGFAMDALPLMRFALLRTAPDAHVFVWSFHHILLDGWCGALLVREVLDLYAGARPGPRPRPFRDFADWHAAQDAEAARAHWASTLAGIEGATPLGIDRTDAGQHGSADYRQTLDPALAARITGFAQAHRLTLAALMQGAWALVLSRYAGQSDVTFGTVLSGRPADLPGVEEMVGLFLQTVPLRVSAPDDAQPADWLAALQAGHPLREAHGHIGLSAIRAAAGLPASAPLIDSLVIVETYPESIEMAVARGGASLRLTATGMREQTDFALVIKLLPGDPLTLCLTADTARIPAAALPRLAGHLTQVMEGLTRATTLAGIDLLTKAERAGLVRVGQGMDLPAAPSTLAQILAIAAAHPARIALETPDGARLTYAGLVARSGQIAASLQDLGIGPGDIVAVCQDRTPDLLASLIAVWRCGATWLPLDPAYPAERIAYILRDAQAVLALADAAGQATLAALDDIGILPVEDCAGASPLPDQVAPGDLAYILYTSGSTGRPKGVPIPHSALTNFLESMCVEPGLTADDRLLALTTVGFDIAGLELFGPLIRGGTVVLAPTGAALDGAGLARMIADHDITIMQATPAGWRVLRDSGWQGAPGLRMISGGEALDSALARDLIGLGGVLWNLYGPTETTIWSAALRVEARHLAAPKVPVGGPIARTVLSLRDGQGRRVPMGVPGELWIGGDGLSPGYLHRPDLTADRFVTRQDARHYRTGDRMRLADDGTLEFMGRFDDQVKLRGYRIELGEVERQIETHPAIAQAVAMVRGEGNTARLTGYLRSDDAPTPAALRAHLAVTLPAYMIPSAWVVLDRFPLTPNGKIDRKALPSPDALPDAGPRPVAASGGARDQVIAAIWAEVLAVPHVAPEDDFFALGGDSIAAMRVIGDIRRHLGVDLALRDLFQTPVLARFCAGIAGGGQALPPVMPGALPVLSAAQHRQWLLARLDPASTDYHLPLALRLTGPLDAARLHGALIRMTVRHAVLRCLFPADQGVARVRVLDDFIPDLPITEARDLDTLRRAEAATPFDLSAAPPWRAHLVRQAADDHVLLLTLHHILADEWSFGVILNELAQGYAGTEAPPPAVQYTDFAAWQRALPVAEARDFWRRRLTGAPAVTALPADRPRPARRDGQAARASFHVGAATTQALERLARANGATLFIVLLSAYALFLSRHTGQRDLLIGTPVSNRRLPELHDLIGLFVNTLVLRADTNAADFPELLARMRDMVLSAHANQDLPFEQLIELMQPPRSESHAPLVQTMFSMADAPRAGDLGGGLCWQALPGGAQGRARFDLSLEIWRDDGGLGGHFDHATDMIGTETGAALARRFAAWLDRIAQSPDMPLADLPLLTAAERAQVLTEMDHAAPSAHLVAGPTTADWHDPAEMPHAFIRDADDRLRPAPGVRALIVDAGGVLLPPGCIGELALAGAGLARGYAGDPAATAAAFRPNPNVDPRGFHPADACLFHTGQAARLDRDGRITLVEGAPDPARLHPAETVACAASGTPPQTDAETVLAAIWAAVLGVPAPGRDQGFFDLGGDSVQAVQVAARATEAGLSLDPRDLFRHPTIAELAAVARPTAPEAHSLPDLDIDPQSIGALVSFGDE
ncbi:MAG: amino acid adenylation domain-containing protein [Paracoccus sp. (in: a-proteobacteria)]|uniref:non-ribosomal peptide synthetase n=1 Tax=Paracoccus sp. TaxID=267 RepID=UPI0026DF1DF5|nr:non-ribosomal peptide synthetase [Paracoccus sp. (in: a-proteobacteria)]MDO5611891.1 amino acid adenylation domain-containing protein [Paracoccus sp. (in: a-proteobacteria)]